MDSEHDLILERIANIKDDALRYREDREKKELVLHTKLDKILECQLITNGTVIRNTENIKWLGRNIKSLWGAITGFIAWLLFK